MNNVANLGQLEREDLFVVTAREILLPEAMVEKDFWVCWTLGYLFHACPWAKSLAFKGGTSLSKCFGLINRFSEDIDIILDWRVLGYKALEPWAERSRTKQDKFNREVNTATEVFLRDSFLPRMRDDLSRLLRNEFSLFIDLTDPQTVCFSYPRIFTESAIVNVVRIEIGALAAWTPVRSELVTSYAAQRYAHVFESPSTRVLTVVPERTFWEKVTILHREAFRGGGNPPPRYSRHFYDLYCIDRTGVKERAYTDLGLLDRVVRFKDRFYPTGSAHYELAKPGTMRLMPPSDYLRPLRNDYEHMKNMIFGEQPDFDDIIHCIQGMEREFNGLP